MKTVQTFGAQNVVTHQSQVLETLWVTQWEEAEESPETYLQNVSDQLGVRAAALNSLFDLRCNGAGRSENVFLGVKTNPQYRCKVYERYDRGNNQDKEEKKKYSARRKLRIHWQDVEGEYSFLVLEEKKNTIKFVALLW